MIINKIKKKFFQHLPLSDFRNNKLAKAYLLATSNDVLHAAFERKEMLRIIGNPKSKNIAIAGSGPGIYSKAFSNHNNIITCIDNSEAMHELAYKELGETVKYLLHDLNEKIPLPDNQFDLIVSPLTVQYIEDLATLFSEFNRVLIPGGKVVISTIHPFVNKGSKYLKQEIIEQEFSEFQVKISAYRRPLGHFFQAIIQSGFSILGVYEPIPDKLIQDLDKNIYESLSSQPLFIFFEIQKVTME